MFLILRESRTSEHILTVEPRCDWGQNVQSRIPPLVYGTIQQSTVISPSLEDEGGQRDLGEVHADGHLKDQRPQRYWRLLVYEIRANGFIVRTRDSQWISS